MSLNRKVREDDLKDKGLPFACENCGNRPTLERVLESTDCEICGESIIAYTTDTAIFINQLMLKACVK